MDYQGMAFPKPGKKKKRKKHKPSILRTQKGVCYLCARLNGDYWLKQTEEHHILFGSGRRPIAEAERELLCRIAQEEYEQTHTREEWMKIAGKNYL